jgi:hypothetical protein
MLVSLKHTSLLWRILNYTILGAKIVTENNFSISEKVPLSMSRNLRPERDNFKEIGIKGTKWEIQKYIKKWKEEKKNP